MKADEHPLQWTTGPVSDRPRGVVAPFPWFLEAARRSHGGEIPRSFSLLADAAAIFLSFIAAQVVAPWLQPLIAPGGPLRADWLEFLRPPAPEDLGGIPALFEALWIPIVVAPVALLAMQALGGYRPVHEQSRSRLFFTSVAAPLFGASSLALVLFAGKHHQVSRLLVFSFVLFSIAAWAAVRFGIRSYYLSRERAGHYAHNVVVIGRGAAVTLLADHFTRRVPSHAFRLAGYLQVPGDVSEPGVPVARLGWADDLGELVIHHPVHDVVAVQDGGNMGWLPKAIEHCDYFKITLRIVPEVLMTTVQRERAPVFRSGPIALPEVVLAPPSLDADALFIKRAADVILSPAALALLAPLLLVIAAAIKITTPHLTVFYPWRVIGYKGKPFTGYKFTTMRADADEAKGDLMHLNEMTGPVFKIKNDPRVTRLGRILRKFSLNELPQFWSVLKGDMSLVGPRPAGPQELERYELWHKRKLSVQPGITCLWQVRGRNDISNFDDWVRMDLEYIDNWSLWLDVKILAWTALAVVKGTGS